MNQQQQSSTPSKPVSSVEQATPSPAGKRVLHEITPGGTKEHSTRSKNPPSEGATQKVKRKLQLPADPSKAPCPKCNREISKANLARHVKSHEEKTMRCDKCPKSYSRPEYLRAHMESHEKENSSPVQPTFYDCEWCPYQSASDLSYFKHHLRTKHPEKLTTCSKCGECESEADVLSDDHVSKCFQYVHCTEALPSLAVPSPVLFPPDPEEPPPEFLAALGDIASSEIVRPLIEHYWPEFKQRTASKNVDVSREYHFRILGSQGFNWKAALTYIYQDIGKCFNLCVAPTLLLRRQPTEDDPVEQYMCYFGQENLVISDQASLNRAIEKLDGLGPMDEYLSRPGSMWTLHCVLSMAVFAHIRPSFLAGRPSGFLPKFIACDTANLQNFTRTNDRHVIKDRLCLFRAIVSHFAGDWTEREAVHGCYNKFRSRLGGPAPEAFEGVDESMIEQIEQLFEIKIQIYSKISADEIECIRLVNDANPANILNVNLFKFGNGQAHFSFIKNLKGYLHRHACDGCNRFFRWKSSLVRHKRLACSNGEPERVYVGGTFQPPPSIFDLLKDWGISVSNDKQLCRELVVFDCESALVGSQEFKFQRRFGQSDQESVEARLVSEGIQVEYHESEVKRFQILNRHVPITVAIASTVETGYRFIHNRDPNVLVKELVEALLELSAMIKEKEKIKFQAEFQRLYEIRDSIKAVLNDGSDEKHFRERAALRKIETVITKFDQYITAATVLTFNGGRYDILLLKQQLMAELVKHVRKSKTRGPDDEREFEGDIAEEADQFLDADCAESDGENEDVEENEFGKERELTWPRSIVRGNRILCLSTRELRILDSVAYTSPGTSLASFIRAYANGEEKGAFPYLLITEYDDLERITTFPRREQFRTPNKELISEARYTEALGVWNSLPEPKSFLRYIEYYNSQDTVPYLKASLEFAKMIHNICDMDCYKQCLSVPGISLTFLFRTLAVKHPSVRFGIFAQEEAQLAEDLRSSIVGGLAVINHRLVESGITKIRGSDHIAQRVVGYDSNSLYLKAIGNDQYTGKVVHWRLDDETKTFQRITKFPDADFKARRIAKEVAYLKFREWDDHVQILTAFDGPQIQLGARQWRCDGWARGANRVYLFNGCHWHEHGRSECSAKNRNFDVVPNPGAQESQRQLLFDLGDLGMEVDIMWECQWTRIESTAKLLAQGQQIPAELQQCIPKAIKLNQYRAGLYKWKYERETKVSEPQMLQSVLDGSLDGFMKVDVQCEEEFKEKYSDFPPIIRPAMVSAEDIGPFMKQIAEAENKLKKPVRTIISSFFGKGIWLTSDMIRFLDANHVKVEKLYEVAQYSKEKEPPFRWFEETVTKHRRASDADPSLKNVGELWKLLGNSSYGKTLTNLNKMVDVFYCDKQKAQSVSNDPFHLRTIPLTENGDVFEVQLKKKRHIHALPIQIGLQVYSEAKRHMFEFLYTVIFEYIDQSRAMLIESDTDSVYLAIDGLELDDVVLPEKREQWFNEIRPRWFVTDEDPDSKRCPGKYKLERAGFSFCGLGPKTYAIHKISLNHDHTASKGIQDSPINQEALAFNNYRAIVLGDPKALKQVHNISFRVVPGIGMTTSIQEKFGLSGLMLKRVFHQDGSSSPLTI